MKKRKRDDENQRRRLDVRAKQRMDRGRKRKMEEKEKTGAKILMPEVFVSNYMKQQRNFLKYKREVGDNILNFYQKVKLGKVKPEEINKVLAPADQIKPNTLILAVRVKE